LRREKEELEMSRSQAIQYESLEVEKTLVGRSVQRLDSLPKVTGRVIYTRDMTLPFMLYGKIKRSPLAHARIVSIDYSRALKISGVKAIVTGNDFPQLGTEETPAIARDSVLYAGQAVAAVAAETRVIAEEALESIDVELEELPIVSDPIRAMSDNPPAVIYHEGENLKSPNIGRHIHVETGDVERAFKEADFIIEDEYRTSAETHFMMEPLTFLAKPEFEGNLTVWATSSGPHKTQYELSRYLGISPTKIRAVVGFLGGWFGSKEESHLAAICAMLAIKSSRPVKLELSREETIVNSGTRHPAIIKVKDGITLKGKIIARQIHAIYDGGAYGLLGNSVLRNSVIAASNVYKIPNFRMDAYRVYTNRTPGSPKRAPVGFQIVFAIESHMDRVASELKMDPVKFREINLIENGEETVLGEKIEGISHKKALNTVMKALTKEQLRQEPGVWKRGRGYSLCAKWSSNGPHQVSVRLREDGTVEVYSGAVENGAGTLTSLAQIVASELDVGLEKIRMMPVLFGSDSAISEAEGGAAASRQLVNHGKALMLACRDLKDKITRKAARILNTQAEDIIVSNGKAISRKNPNRYVEISSFFSHLPILGITKLSIIKEGDDLVGNAIWMEELGEIDEKTGHVIGSKISPYYVTVCQGAEVSVNIETGQIVVDRVVAAMDIGKAVNPALVQGQIAGSVGMALGSALCEELVLENGHVVNANLADYKILTSVDMPRVETIILETPWGEGPFGARGAGEASTLATPAAIRNAIHDAVGIWINKLPIRPADVLLALSSKEKREREG
jgi:CO/xanthine dehydrogenase Mo-binding subunit